MLPLLNPTPLCLLSGPVARLRKYKEYLEKTTDSDQNYEEVQDLLNRHKTLVDLNRDLQEQEAKVGRGRGGE